MTQSPILLVEDNASDIKLTRRAFAKSNIANSLVAVENGGAALDYLLGDARHALPALVLLDLNLPKVDGLEVLRRIRADKRTRFLPVVVMTNSQEQQDLIDSYRFGANSYIRKPVSFSEFSAIVAELGAYWLSLNKVPPASDAASEWE